MKALLNAIRAWWRRMQAPNLNSLSVDAIVRLSTGKTFAELAPEAQKAVSAMITDLQAGVAGAKAKVAEDKRVLKADKAVAKTAGRNLTEAELLAEQVNAGASAIGMNNIQK